MTNHRQEKVHALIRPRLMRGRTRKRVVAEAAPIRPRLRPDDVRLILAFMLLALAASVLVVGVLAAAVRSGRAIIGDLVPGWPWW